MLNPSLRQSGHLSFERPVALRPCLAASLPFPRTPSRCLGWPTTLICGEEGETYIRTWNNCARAAIHAANFTVIGPMDSRVHGLMRLGGVSCDGDQAPLMTLVDVWGRIRSGLALEHPSQDYPAEGSDNTVPSSSMHPSSVKYQAPSMGKITRTSLPGKRDATSSSAHLMLVAAREQ